jgi:transcriptional regulator with XRE-family HTH domain
MKAIQERILTIMSIKNVTNAEFADAIGVQPSNISHILSGRNKPSLDLVMKIVKRYPEVRLEWLLQGVGSMNKEYDMDLFSAQKNEPARNEKVSSNAESKIYSRQEEKDKSRPSFEGEMELKEVKTARNQVSSVKSVASDEMEGKKDFSAYIDNSDVGIEKIVIFYRDRTFKAYTPGSH